jgi:hypothetical protein
LAEQRLLHLDCELRQIGRRGPQAGGGMLGIDVPRIGHPLPASIVRASGLLLTRLA